ncbi:MAG: AMP-dependent synthetase and ligase [Actinomycetia bacterium]|nr:AMP-dependent synthetase and ligase [Actinomycetes bacterium]
MKIVDTPRALRALARSGLLAPTRPDRLLRAGFALRYWGMSLAAGFAAGAARFGDRIGIIDERGPLTYGELDRRGNALAHGLRALGVEPGTVVGILCRNHRYFVDITGACSKVGAHALYLNTAFSVPQLREVVAREQVGALVVDEEFTPIVEGFDAGPIVLAWTEGSERTSTGPTIDQLVAQHDPTPPPRPTVIGRTIVLTSGTTGTPKGASREHTAAIGPAFAMLDRIPYEAGETMLIAAPMFHSWGFGNFTIGLALGDTMVCERRFDPEATLAAIEQHRANVLVAVPVMLQRILELPPEVCARYDTSSLRLVPLSGSAIPGGLAPRWMKQFGPNIYNLYGSTEVGYATVATPEDLEAAPGTAGKPPAGTTVKIFDERGNELPTGETGRIFVHSDLLFDGYTGGGSKPMLDGFMSTGDTGHFDANGRLFVEGREDEMIVSGGENVFPREVEDLLSSRDDVVEAAVVGVPDEEFGQRLKAYVVRAPGQPLDADTVRNYVKANLAGFKVPRDVEFVDELPRNATGKVVKRAL